MRVDIYITSQFTGRVMRGHGVYGIVLVTEINGKKYAKAHMAGWNDISYQKLSARAVVDAIQCMNTSAQVVIHLDNAYAEHMAKKGSADGNAYSELWSTFYKKSKEMEQVKVERCSKHEYTEYLHQRMRERQYTVMEDR